MLLLVCLTAACTRMTSIVYTNSGVGINDLEVVVLPPKQGTPGSTLTIKWNITIPPPVICTGDSILDDGSGSPKYHALNEWLGPVSGASSKSITIPNDPSAKGIYTIILSCNKDGDLYRDEDAYIVN